MLLVFPNADRVRQAVASGVVPPEVALAPVRAVREADGTHRLLTSATLPRGKTTELRGLGVEVTTHRTLAGGRDFPHWLQLLPLVKEPGPVTLGERTPVLFETADAAQFLELSGEMLRLGNDRQGIRWVADRQATRALLRVLGPPYYSVLRALDPQGVDAPRAYLERRPRVWIAAGWRHPFEDWITPPAGKIVLLRPADDWELLDEQPFQDLYEVLDLQLPDAAVATRSVPPAARLPVALRLQRGGPPDPAEMWIFERDGDARLEELVRTLDNAVVNRLLFAVAEHADERFVLLRVRPDKQAPPVLVLDALASRSYLRLPNLFVPCDSRLQPPLRRDALKKLLAEDVAQITWLRPVGGTFQALTLPDAAFRPLADYVEYVLDRDRGALTSWIQSTTFDFEDFIVEELPAEPRERRPAQPEPEPEPEDDAEVPLGSEARAAAVAAQVQTYIPPVVPAAPTVTAALPPNELQERLRELEAEFRESEAAFGAPERGPAWRDMAVLQTALGNRSQATVCWVNALWFPEPPVAWWEEWLRAEAPGLPSPATTADLVSEVDALLTADEWVPGGATRLAALLTYLGRQLAATEVHARLELIQGQLHSVEDQLPVRAAWLAWRAYAGLAEGDLLALAAARDRLLERLHRSGLSAERDVAAFIRFAHPRSGTQVNAIRDQLLRVRELSGEWLSQRSLGPKITRSYADLMFAFGLARLGEVAQAQELRDDALAEMLRPLPVAAPPSTGRRRPEPPPPPQRDPVHRWIGEALALRIDAALRGESTTGELSRDLQEDLATMQRDHRLKVDRLRQHSRIIEPHGGVDAYGRYLTPRGPLGEEIAALYNLVDLAELHVRLTRLLDRSQPQGLDRMPLYKAALELAPRLGEAFAVPLLGAALGALTEAPLGVQLTLLERALFLAAHFDRAAEVREVVARFHQLLAGEVREELLHDLESLLAQSFVGLRKLGMRDEIGGLLQQVDRIVQQRPAVEPTSWSFIRSKQYKLRLYVAAGWFYFNYQERAVAILDEVRAALLSNDLEPQHVATVAAAYLTALRSAPWEHALPRFEDLFRSVHRVSDNFTTNSHYQLSQLLVIEAAVLSLASDDLNLDETGKRWLDEDEFLVRQRVHQDVRTALKTAGIE